MVSLGIVLDCGESISQFVPIYEGYGIKHATEAKRIGGRHITERLRELIRNNGCSMSTTAEFEIIKQMKEEFCFDHF